MNDPTTEVSISFLWLVIVAVLATLFMSMVLIWAILRLRKEPHPTILIMTLAVTTMVIVLTFALTKAEVLATLAGTGLGALAASLTTVLRSDKQDKEDNRSED